MKISSLVGSTVAVALLAIPFSSQAASWSCKMGNIERDIQIQTDTPGSSVPCKVVYKKTSEGVADQTPYNATNDAAYCEEKAKGLADKLASLGWTCVESVAAAKTAPQTGTGQQTQ